MNQPSVIQPTSTSSRRGDRLRLRRAVRTKKLKRADVDVTLISRTTHHLFQPLLYQVATGILSEGEIAPATREILRRQQATCRCCSARSPTST